MCAWLNLMPVMKKSAQPFPPWAIFGLTACPRDSRLSSVTADFVLARLKARCWLRSEERRVGKECRSRWGREDYRKIEQNGAGESCVERRRRRGDAVQQV